MINSVCSHGVPVIQYLTVLVIYSTNPAIGVCGGEEIIE